MIAELDAFLAAHPGTFLLWCVLMGLALGLVAR